MCRRIVACLFLPPRKIVRIGHLPLIYRIVRQKQGLSSKRPLAPLAFRLFTSAEREAELTTGFPFKAAQRCSNPTEARADFSVVSDCGKDSVKRGMFTNLTSHFSLGLRGRCFRLGFAFSMFCLRACIRSMICARCDASGAVTVIS